MCRFSEPNTLNIKLGARLHHGEEKKVRTIQKVKDTASFETGIAIDKVPG